jgi:hypothetical protein
LSVFLDQGSGRDTYRGIPEAEAFENALILRPESSVFIDTPGLAEELLEGDRFRTLLTTRP